MENSSDWLGFFHRSEFQYCHRFIFGFFSYLISFPSLISPPSDIFCPACEIHVPFNVYDWASGSLKVLWLVMEGVVICRWQDKRRLGETTFSISMVKCLFFLALF